MHDTAVVVGNAEVIEFVVASAFEVELLSRVDILEKNTNEPVTICAHLLVMEANRVTQFMNNQVCLG